MLALFLPVLEVIITDHISVSFRSKDVYDLTEKGVISQTLKIKEFPTFNALKSVNYSAYISNQSNFSNDFPKARLREILIRSFLPFFLLIIMFSDSYKNQGDKKKFEQLNNLGIGFSFFAFFFSILDNNWLIHIFFSEVFSKILLVDSYDQSSIALNYIIPLIALFSFLYQRRKTVAEGVST